MCTRRLLVIASVPLVLAGCGSGTKQAASTNPTPTAPASQTTSPATATFTSRSFAPGLSFTLPDASWKADEPIEGTQITVTPPGHPAQAVQIFKSMIPTNPDGSRMSAKNTPSAMANALRHQAFLVTTAPTTRTVGRGVTAMALDVRTPANQAREFLLVYRLSHYGVSLQVTRGETVRIYFVAVSTPTGPDTLVISVAAPSGATFTSFAKTVGTVLASLTFPDALTPAR